MWECPRDGGVHLMSDQTRSTRRSFLTRSVYAGPTILTLAAARRAAAEFTGCVGPGSPCAMGNECCNFVNPMSCHQVGNSMVCMETPPCECD